jgi:mutator protein MutT
LIKKSQGEIAEICLALKKRGFGMGRYNGAGGKVEEGLETIEEAAIRETQEEIGVETEELKKIAELSFYFPHKSDWDQKVHVYFVENWDGEPRESEEMDPRWFSIDKIPFEKMWPDDIFWLPRVLNGERIEAMFIFGEGDVIQDKKIMTK